MKKYIQLAGFSILSFSLFSFSAFSNAASAGGNGTCYCNQGTYQMCVNYCIQQQSKVQSIGCNYRGNGTCSCENGASTATSAGEDCMTKTPNLTPASN